MLITLAITDFPEVRLIFCCRGSRKKTSSDKLTRRAQLKIAR
jgi:hypothetical protein